MVILWWLFLKGNSGAGENASLLDKGKRILGKPEKSKEQILKLQCTQG